MKTILLVLMLIASSASGMVYTWIDSGGIRHYTNKEHEIPAPYRAKAKSLYPEQADSASSPQQNTPSQQAKPDIQQSSPAAQVKAEDTPKPQLPVSTPELQKNVPEKPIKRTRRIRLPREAGG